MTTPTSVSAERHPATPGKERSRRIRRRLKAFSTLRLLLLLLVYLPFAVAAGLYFAYTEFNRDLPPNLTAMREAPNKATRVFSADGELIGEFFLQKRVVVAYDQIPEHVSQAFVAAEDGRFWEHPGFDPIGITRAAYSNYKGTGSRQGASTITQQLTRMLMLSNERTYERKIKELILSIRVERELNKRDILGMYLNRVYLGRGAHGVQAAAEAYFGKDVAHLTLGEASLLAGLVQRPSDYAPTTNLEAARTRQDYVLSRMVNDGAVSELQATTAKSELLAFVPDDVPLNDLAAPHFVEHVRRWVTKRFGHNSVFYGGLRIYTTLDIEAQRVAEAAVRQGLESLDRRIGFRGPVGHLEEEEEIKEFRSQAARPYIEGNSEAASLASGAELIVDVAYVGVVTRARGKLQIALGQNDFELSRPDSRWLASWRKEDEDGTSRIQALRVGDLLAVKLVDTKDGEPALVPAQRPDIQGSLVALDPHSGRIEAMVGGYDYRQSEFNRATQAKRQIGSAFKPFIYATAMQQGTSHLSILRDAPITVRTAGGLWSPKNYSGGFRGSMTLRTALAKSVNTISVRLLLKVGVAAVIATARRLGVISPIPNHVSIALGTPDLTLLEVVGAYSAFPNGGKRVAPQDNFADGMPGRFVDLVTTDSGDVVADFRDSVPTEQVIPASLAFMVVELMKTVVRRGTARKALAIGRPAAGKTGTSTGWRDAWFLGYTSERICGVWVGRDNFTPIGAKATGGGAALPIWVDYMLRAHPETPPTDFAVPDDILLVRANEITGRPASPGSGGAVWVPFLRGTVPSEFGRGVSQSPFEQTEDFRDRKPREL